MRLVFDLSSMVRWHGPPVGMMRVQQHYSALALGLGEPEVVFTAFDPVKRVMMQVSPDMAAAIIGGEVACDMSFYSDPARIKVRFYDRWPGWARRLLIAAIRPRRLLRLEVGAFRRSHPGKTLAPLLDRIDNWLTKPAERLTGKDGKRIRVVPFRTVVKESFNPQPGDHLLLMNSDWAHTDISIISGASRAANARLVVLLHDIIPIQFPEWYRPHDVARFTDYVKKAMGFADRIILTSRRVQTDLEEYCGKIGASRPETARVPLGCDGVREPKAQSGLPAELDPGRYILFVSTIEPRKNHAMLMEVWRRLAVDGTIARHGVKLVFAGREGWMVGEVLAKLHGHPEYGKSLLHYGDVDDDALTRLYEGSAFCVYPSLYEGYGLPPVEALFHGKALIASTGGAIGEVVGPFGLCLDPADADGWEDAMRQWISDPESRATYEEKARTFTPRTWEQAGKETLAAALRPFPNEPGQPPGLS